MTYIVNIDISSVHHLLTCLSHYFGESVSMGLYGVGYSPFYYFTIDTTSLQRTSYMLQSRCLPDSVCKQSAKLTVATYRQSSANRISNYPLL